MTLITKADAPHMAWRLLREFPDVADVWLRFFDLPLGRVALPDGFGRAEEKFFRKWRMLSVRGLFGWQHMSPTPIGRAVAEELKRLKTERAR